MDIMDKTDIVDEMDKADKTDKMDTLDKVDKQDICVLIGLLQPSSCDEVRRRWPWTKQCQVMKIGADANGQSIKLQIQWTKHQVRRRYDGLSIKFRADADIAKAMD